MPDLLEETIHDKKYERNFQAFKRSLPFIITLTICVAITMYLVDWYGQYRLRQYAKIGDGFIDLVLENPLDDPETMSTSFDDFIKNTENHQAELGEIKYVANLIALGDIDHAISRLDQIIANKEYLDITVAYARLITLQLFLDMAELSDEQKEKAEKYITYFINENQPFYMTSTLVKAFYYKKIGEIELARNQANKIFKMKNASDILIEQAKAFLSQLPSSQA